jgi:hypothetical protein
VITIWGLTSRGIRVARNPHNPNTPVYKIVAFLDKVPRASKETINDYCGLSPTQTAVILRALKARGIVAEETEVNV